MFHIFFSFIDIFYLFFFLFLGSFLILVRVKGGMRVCQ